MAGDLRVGWGVAVVVLILGYSRATRSSFQRLHFLGHAVRTDEGRDQALALLLPGRDPPLPLVRVQPWLNRAVNFAAAMKLVDIDGGKAAVLTDLGKSLLKEIAAVDELLIPEKAFLSEVKSFASEKNIEAAMRVERRLWV